MCVLIPPTSILISSSLIYTVLVVVFATTCFTWSWSYSCRGESECLVVYLVASRWSWPASGRRRCCSVPEEKIKIARPSPTLPLVKYRGVSVCWALSSRGATFLRYAGRYVNNQWLFLSVVEPGLCTRCAAFIPLLFLLHPAALYCCYCCCTLLLCRWPAPRCLYASVRSVSL